MPINSLPSELLTISGIPDGPRVEAVVGDVVSFAPLQTAASPTVTLARKPSGSSATVSSNAITFDVSGLFRVTVAAGGFSRSIEVIVFPASALNIRIDPGYGAAQKTVSRTHLRALAMDPSVTPATVTATLEVSPVVYTGLVGSTPNTPPLWTNYGN